MSTKKKVIVTTTPKVAPSTAQRSKTTASSARNTSPIFGRQNYLLMLVGLALIAVGMMLMSGGAMPDPNTWDENLIYSSRRILLAPVIILIGLVVEIFAIFKSSGAQDSDQSEEVA